MRLLLQAGFAVTADFRAGNGDLHVKVPGDLFSSLFVQAAFEFTQLAAAEAGDMDVVARAMRFVIVPVAA
ncbi:MAG: hypothetical protein PVS2B2_20330 [Candidatus Acidiferrum sp.]